MKVTTIISTTLLLLLIGWLSLGWTRAQAQSSPIDLSVSPPTEYLHVAPGKAATHTVTLEQQGSLPLKVTLSLVDFTSDGETGQPVLNFAEGSKFRYLKVQNPDVKLGQPFDLNPGQKKQIQVVIEPSSEAVQGEYPLTLLFSAQPNADFSLTSGTQVSGMVGSNLIVLISTSDNDKGKLSLETIQGMRLVDSFGSLAFTILARNDGRNATTASGSAQVRNWQDNVVSEYTFYPDMILAGSSRLLRHGASLEDDAPDALTSTFRYKPMVLIGPYSITATLHENGQVEGGYSTLTIQVFAFPFSLVLLLILGVTLYSIYRYFINRSERNG